MSLGAHADNPKTSTLAATGTLVATAKGRVLGIHLVGGATAGAVTLRDGGGAGTVLATLGVSVTEDCYVSVPGGGLGFGTDLHGTVTNATRVTVFYALD